MRPGVALVVVAFALASACGRNKQPLQPVALPGLELVSLKFEPSTQTPSVTTARDGTVLLTWQQDEPTAVRWRRRAVSGTWSEARTLVESDDLFVNWADFPMMTAFDDERIVAGWLRRSSERAYGISLGYTDDAGEHWSTSQLHAHTGGPSTALSR